MKKALVFLFAALMIVAVAAPAMAVNVNILVTWTNPTTYDDATPMGAVTVIPKVYADESNPPPQLQFTGTGGETSYVQTFNISPGDTRYFQGTSTVAGETSALSNVILFTWNKTPSAPTMISATVQ